MAKSVVIQLTRFSVFNEDIQSSIFSSYIIIIKLLKKKETWMIVVHTLCSSHALFTKFLSTSKISVLGICLGTTYLAKTENILLKVL